MGNGYTTTLPLEVFTQRNFVADFIRLKLNCIQTRVIALLCGINISALHCLVLSQSTRVTDRRTDRQVDRITTPKTALA